MSYWKTKKLAEMTAEEWESLCDSCGKCCLHKLEDEDTGKIVFTSVVCKLIDLKTCRCTRYAERTRLVADCLDLKQNDFTRYDWLPATCAYRLLNDGKELPAWLRCYQEAPPVSKKRAFQSAVMLLKNHPE